MLPPVGVRENDNVVGFISRLVFGKRPPYHRTAAQCGKEVRRNLRDLLASCRAGLANDRVAVAIDCKGAEGRYVTTPLVVVGQGGAVPFDARLRVRVEDGHQSSGIRKRQWAEQYGI